MKKRVKDIMTYINDNEKILYRIVEELSKLDAPIIFKGALALIIQILI